MNSPGIPLIEVLMRTTLALSTTAIVMAIVLRVLRPTSVRLQRLAWLLVLVQGCIAWRVPVHVPWFNAAASDGLVAGAEDFYARQNHGPLAQFLKPLPTDLASARQPNGSHFVWLRDMRNWQLLIVGVWLGGIFVTVAVWVWRYAGFVRGLQQPAETPGDWVHQWEQLLVDERVTRRISMRVTRDIGPCLCRLPSGYEVFVPGTLWGEFSREQRLAILRHELAHFRRGDLWKSFAARLLALVHWFNPVAWWVVNRFDECAEWECDKLATQSSLKAASEFSKVLLILGTAPAGTTLYASAVRRGPVTVRIHRLLSSSPVKDSTVNRLIPVVLAAALIIAHIVRLELAAKESLVETTGPNGQSGAVAATNARESSSVIRVALNDANEKSDEQKAEGPSENNDSEVAKRWSELSKKEAAETTSRHIHGLVRAAHLYADQHGGTLPQAVIANPKLPAGKRLSGFVLLLPYLKADSWINKGEPCFDPETVKLAGELYQMIDQTKAWDDPANLKAAKTAMPAFLAPQSAPFRDKKGYAVSHFAFVQGSMMGFDGAFPGEAGVKIADITDGTVGTLAFGQIVSDLGPWIAEGLPTARQVFAATQTSPGAFGSQYKSGCYFAMCDSTPFFHKLDADAVIVLQTAATRSGGELIDNMKMTRKMLPFEIDVNQ